jgi:hypothetical protein
VDEVKDAFDTKLLISKTSAGQSIAEMA